MNGTIHLKQQAKTLWKKVLLLGLALFLFEMLFAIVGMSTDIKANMLRDIKEVPPLFQKMIGKDMLNAFVKYGIIALGYMHPFMMVMFIIFPFMAVSQMVTSEISSGAIGFTLSRPVSRQRIYLNLAIIICLGLAVLVIFTYLSTFLGIRLFYGPSLTVEPFSSLAWNIYLLMIFIAGYIVLLSAIADTGKKLFTLGGVALLLLYLLNFAAPLWKPLEVILPFNPFSYYNPFGVLMGERVGMGTSVLLIVFSAGMFWLAGWIFKRRDIAGG